MQKASRPESQGGQGAEEGPFGALAPRDRPPDDRDLRALLGALFPEFEATRDLLRGLKNGWKHYGAKIGWLFKSEHKGKALLWLIPLPAGFKANFTLRPAEREALLGMEGLAALRDSLAAAPLLPEGYGLSVLVRGPEDGAALRALVRELLVIRMG